MIHRLNNCVLRPPEPKDGTQLYQFKNDPEIAKLLGGFHMGMAKADILEWIEYHRKCKDEVIWVIADHDRDQCLGQVGFYKIDHRVRSAEFAISIGDKDWWGRGLGKLVSRHVITWGFTELNLNRVYLSVLTTTDRAIRLYRSIGFVEEGRLRQAQFKNNTYIDMYLMSILHSEFKFED